MLAQKWLTTAPWINWTLRKTNPQQLKTTVPTLATWGLAAAFAVTLFFEPVPIFRKDVLSKLPLLGSVWEKKLEQRARVD